MGAGTKLIPAKMFLLSITVINTNQDTYYGLEMAPVMASKASAVFNFSTQHIF
jgi:hypothetical protein